jgi:glutamine amidotransferase
MIQNKNSITIVDYGMGNIFSVKKALERLNVQVDVTSDPVILSKAAKIILPGVGHFGKAMDNLYSLQLVDVLSEVVLEKKVPVLGICLGMQLMAKHSEEGDATGLAWIDADVVRFQVRDKLRYKVPQIAWNNVNISKESALMQNIEKDAEFYFLHSYFMKLKDENDALCTTLYEDVFVSGIEKDNIFGIQFHPEKSHEAGGLILSNFIEL